MSYELCKKVRDLTPYDPLQGNYDLRLDANESYLSLSDELKVKAAAIASEAALNRYPDPYAEELCAAFGDYYGIDPKLVTAGNGSDELIGLIVGALLQKGEKIANLTPDFSMYRFYGEIYENPVVQIPKGEDFSIDPQTVIDEVKRQKVKLLIFSNPCNPTSVGLEAKDVRKIVRGVDALVVLDEAYMDFWDQSLLSEVSDYDNLIILKTCSKAIGMAALRVGFAVANENITKALKAVKSPYNVNAISQAIAARVLRDKVFLRECEGKIIASAKNLKNGVNELAARYPVLERVYVSCTNFVYIKTAAAQEIYQKLLQKSIAVRCFGGYLRISTDSIDNNQLLFTALEEILPKFH